LSQAYTRRRWKFCVSRGREILIADTYGSQEGREIHNEDSQNGNGGIVFSAEALENLTRYVV
jgi:hypothetical protein